MRLGTIVRVQELVLYAKFCKFVIHDHVLSSNKAALRRAEQMHRFVLFERVIMHSASELSRRINRAVLLDLAVAWTVTS